VIIVSRRPTYLKVEAGRAENMRQVETCSSPEERKIRFDGLEEGDSKVLSVNSCIQQRTATPRPPEITERISENAEQFISWRENAVSDCEKTEFPLCTENRRVTFDVPEAASLTLDLSEESTATTRRPSTPHPLGTKQEGI
jgi:hypothetical protein